MPKPQCQIEELEKTETQTYLLCFFNILIKIESGLTWPGPQAVRFNRAGPGLARPGLGPWVRDRAGPNPAGSHPYPMPTYPPAKNT